MTNWLKCHSTFQAGFHFDRWTEQLPAWSESNIPRWGRLMMSSVASAAMAEVTAICWWLIMFILRNGILFMRELQATLMIGLATGFAMFGGPSFVVAASPRPLRVEQPLVVLSQQIEELEETAPPAIIPTTSPPNSSGSTISQTSASLAWGASTHEQPSPNSRQFFPAARQFFRKLTSTSSKAQIDPASNRASAGPSMGTPPAPERQVMAASAFTLEPMPQQPFPSSPPQSSSTGLIVPYEHSVADNCALPCDEPVFEAPTQQVSPRSHKIGSRLRFPDFSRLVGK